MKLVILLLISLCSTPVLSQIVFEKDLTWEQLSKKAKAEKKLIFLHLEDDNCQQCNDVASQGFGASLIKEKYQTNFVSLRANVNTPNGKKLADKFDIKGALISLYIDADGNILNRYNGSTSAGFTYAEQADVAISRKGDKKLSDYEKEYKTGQRSSQFLKEYIVKRKQLLQPVGDLLDTYVGQLPVDSLINFDVIRFVYGNGPSLDSRAYKVIQFGAPVGLIDSLYKAVPVEEAVAMNNAIISNTYSISVEKKDKNLAYQLSTFILGTYNLDFRKGYTASRRTMLRFWYAIKDTAQYKNEAISFINQTHMSLTVDSLKKMDAQQMKNQAPRPPAPFRKDHVNIKRFAPPSQYFHMDLNEHAWHFYEMSDKVGELETALKWSYQSMEFFNGLHHGQQDQVSPGNPAYLDTYAHLLYKLGRKQEAIEWQSKALEAQKLVGSSTSYETTLTKMKEGKL